jgi:hypothetical protein
VAPVTMNVRAMKSLIHLAKKRGILVEYVHTLTAQLFIAKVFDNRLSDQHPAVADLWFSRRHANELEIDARVKSFAETNRKFEDSIIGRRDDDIARGVQNGGADLAVIQMRLHGNPAFRQAAFHPNILKCISKRACIL